MTFKVFNPEKAGETTRLQLRQSDSDVLLLAVDENGNGAYCGNLIIFQSNGKFRRCLDVSTKLGFQLDNIRRIKEV